MGLRQDKRSRDCQGAVSPPQESGPATSLRPPKGIKTPRVFDRAVGDCQPTGVYREFMQLSARP